MNLPTLSGTCALVAVMVTCCLPHSVEAQTAVSTIDFGRTTIHSDSVNGSAFTVAPSLRVEWPHVTLDGAGSYSQFGANSQNAQGALDASLFTPAAGPLAGEVAGSLGGSVQENGAHTGEMIGTGRVHLMRRAVGLWAGAGGGQAWDGARWRAIRTTEGGVWGSVARTIGVLFATPTVIDDSTRYTDVQVALRWLSPRFEIGASMARRMGLTAPTARDATSSWGSLTATAWLGAHAALVVGGGAYPADYMQGYPGGRFVSVGFRLASRSETNAALDQRELRRAAAQRREIEPGPGGLARLDVGPSSGRYRTVRVYAPSARQVELSGDFTSWAPVSLTRTGDGWWTARLVIASGVHEVNVRIDGGQWTVPPSMATITDDFGNRSALLAVP
jgi:Glycogen recognition site of AMP-activated protein kinase